MNREYSVSARDVRKFEKMSVEEERCENKLPELIFLAIVVGACVGALIGALI
jgi:hypothetical protein